MWELRDCCASVPSLSNPWLSMSLEHSSPLPLPHLIHCIPLNHNLRTNLATCGTYSLEVDPSICTLIGHQYLWARTITLPDLFKGVVDSHSKQIRKRNTNRAIDRKIKRITKFTFQHLISSSSDPLYPEEHSLQSNVSLVSYVLSQPCTHFRTNQRSTSPVLVGRESERVSGRGYGWLICIPADSGLFPHQLIQSYNQLLFYLVY